MITGYSDRINHAFAFAAKHHDQQVRKGTRAPYFTQPANVAVILTRYGQDEDTVVAGILQSAVSDYVRESYTAEMLERRIGDKFGMDVLDTTLKVVERRYDDDDVEMSADERKNDVLTRLAHADDRARWVLAADALHTGGTVLADLQRTEFPETVWSRLAAGREGTVRWYRRVHDRLIDVGFTPAIVQELRAVTESLEQLRTETARR
ncbi:MAG TPA: HD domain-containing protein [Gemmatimonadaceae bacterium]|nr:HD domain-containing protein [Gemmatimonadaceae bacterium]